MTGRQVDIGTVVGRLSESITALCHELLPAGVKEGREWCVGSVAGEPGRSMKVHLEGPRAGVWADFGGAPGDRGDALDLVAAVLFRGDKKQALRWARAWLGLDNADPNSFTTQQALERQKKHKQEAIDEEKKIRGIAQHIFIGAREKIADTLADRYLRGRGLELTRLGRQPACLRFHPELMHPETGELAPALVAAITSPADELVAVHRTFLEELADGRVVKLRGVNDAKLTLGRYAGGCIRLWRGASGKPWKETLPGEEIMVGEGLEDTLTGVLECPEYRAAVAVSLANMGGLVLPAAAGGVLILAQNDKKPQAIAALERAIAHFQGAGKRVRLARPADDVKDLNELAQRELQQGAAS